ncbi:MAG TPA: polyamine ABC transporter ATP-binding protein [Clostridiaceae bacterium]|nr:polyamine ABC transporter ATP-binding protein [Clostridiaceae bacterium]
MAFLSIKNLTKKYDGNTVLDSISLDIEKGSFLSLLGPSGCGKTTTLRLLAGFEKCDGGIIEVNGKMINDIPVYSRNFGMVFQSYALFPHMTVEQNIAYGLEQRKMSKKDIKEEVAKAIEMVRLAGYEKRRPKQLSGGQQQRVALARALVIKPDLLLLDESLSALDKKLRVEMQVELRQIQKKIGITTIFVTHDQEEALTLSDRIAVMKAGKIIQIGTPEEIYETPKDTFVASFLGQANFFKGSIAEKQDNSYALRLKNDGVMSFVCEKNIEPGQLAAITVRPEKVEVSRQAKELSLKGTVLFVTYVGDTSIYRVKSMGQEVIVQRQNTGNAEKYDIGDEVYLSWKPENSLVLEWDGEE